MTTTQTHYDGCWYDPWHHACAVAEIERLRTVLTTARAEALEEAVKAVEDAGGDNEDYHATAICALKERGVK